MNETLSERIHLVEGPLLGAQNSVSSRLCQQPLSCSPLPCLSETCASGPPSPLPVGLFLLLSRFGPGMASGSLHPTFVPLAGMTLEACPEKSPGWGIRQKVLETDRLSPGGALPRIEKAPASWCPNPGSDNNPAEGKGHSSDDIYCSSREQYIDDIP